ncbi:MAG: hypothetical protein KGS10_17650 [Chloroflexi bacterium]|jgi:hypothetical protein|nr:hypothetical protein [Chloroflexota bacterium]
MGILQGLYEDARRATDHARRRTFEARARLEAARLEVATLEASLAGAERDLASTVAAEAEARRRWVARAGARRHVRPAGAVVTAITSLAATVRAGAAAVTTRAAQA